MMARGGTSQGLSLRKPGGGAGWPAPRQEKDQAPPARKHKGGPLDEHEEYSISMWGYGDQYQLGNGKKHDRLTPLVMLFTKTQITSIACGAKHTLAVLGPSHAPRVFAWGEGQYGQLGIAKSASMNAMHPVEVKALSPTSTFMVTEVGAGGNGSFALTSKQELLLWGDNSSEQLGLGGSFKGVDKVFSPKPLSPNWDTTEMQWRLLYIQKVVLGVKFGLAVDKYGRLYAWGENNYGQLGVGDKAARNTPVMVENLANVRHIAVGRQHSAAIDTSRKLWTWGDCADGRLGHGPLFTEVRSVKGDIITRSRKRVDHLSEPKCVEFFRTKEVRLVACGDRFTVALDSRSIAWTWGSGIYGQLGTGSRNLSSELPARVLATQFVRIPSQGPVKKLAHTVRMSEDETGHKDETGIERTPRSGSEGEESHEWVGGRSMSSHHNSFQQQSSESMKLGILEEPSMSSVNKASLEMPIFRTIQAGPYHCAALTDDGRVFTWGKGKHGVLGQGTEYNHYEPVQVQTDPQIPVTLFCTGEYHSLVVQDADRLDMLDAGYSMRAIPNTDNFAYIPERDLNAEDLEARFKVDENAPIERYNSEGRTSKGKFSNLLGVTEAGKIVIDTGLGTEEVEPDEVNPARALSLRGVKRDIVLDREGIVPSAEKFLKCEGWDLLEEHIPEWPAEMCAQLDPLLENTTPAEIKSKWGQYTPRFRESTFKKARGMDADDISRGRVATPPESPKARSPSFGKGSGFTNLKSAMAVETNREYDNYHAHVVEKNRHCIISAHNRQPYDAEKANIGNTCRVPVNNGKTVMPCCSIFSQAERFPATKKGDLDLGPGEYGVNDNHAEWTKLESVMTIKPAGVGVTLTLKENFSTYQQSSHSHGQTHGQFDIAVKAILKGGSVDSSNHDGRSKLSVGDTILKIGGEIVSTLYEARRKMMGAPGTRIEILYKHKDKSGGSTKMNHTFVRRYHGKNEDIVGKDALTEVYPAPGRYVGLGLQAERFNDQQTGMLPQELEDEVLNLIVRLQEEMTPDNNDLLKNRPCVIPAVTPGIKRVTEEMLKLFPEWSEVLSRPNAIMRIFKKYSLIQPLYSDQRENSHMGPGAYSPKRTSAHKWTEDGEIAQSTVTHANTTGTRWVTPEQKEDKLAPTTEDLRREAEEIGVGRQLEPGEFERLPGWKQRKLQAIMALMDRRDDHGPGPLQYSNSHPSAIGQPRMGYKESEVGHHLKGLTIAPKATSSKGAATFVSPGPDHYTIRREGLEASGDFLHKKGGVVVYRDKIGPDQVDKEIPGIFYEKPGSISSVGHEVRKTPYTNSPSCSISTREGWEKLANHQAGQYYDQDSKTWAEKVPGPGSYTPRHSTASRAAALHGRESLDKKNTRALGLVYDPVSKDYINDKPGPVYLPMALKDGKSMEPGKSGRSTTPGIRLDRKTPSFVTPGPGFYDMHSCFDKTEFNLFKGTKGGPYNHGWIGEKTPAPKAVTNVPGPIYDVSYEAIGTDLVSIGAATRAATGSSATEAVRKKDARDTHIKPVLNYSAMNKAVEELKKTLGEMFENVYEAFAFFDIDGDWGISESEFKRMLANLDIHMEGSKLGLVVRRMDVVADGMIDPKEFIQALRWHPSMYKKFSDEEAAMHRASQKRGKIVKDAMLKVAENRVHALKMANLKRQNALFSAAEIGSRTAKSPTKSTIELVKPQRPLTARADMRRGFTITPRRRQIVPKWGDTPGPAGYLPHSAGDLAIKVGKGKDAYGHQARDSLCWAGSSLTSKAAPLSCKLAFGAGEKGEASPGPAGYSVARFPDDKFQPRGRHDNAKQKKPIN